MTSGAYAFVTEDWRTKGYPLDLWLQHTLPLFDKVSLATYGTFPLPFSHPKLRVTPMPAPERKTFTWFTDGMNFAQHNLDTDWKVLLSVDEFLDAPILFSNLDEHTVHSLVCRNLYGNLNTEILIPLLYKVARIHKGYRAVIKDGVVSGPRNRFFSAGQFWHTSFLRKPSVLSIHERARAPHEIAQGHFLKENETMLKLTQQDFEYRRYKEVWPSSSIVSIPDSDLPRLLLMNRSDFDWCAFQDDPLRTSVEGRLRVSAHRLRWLTHYTSTTLSR